MDSEESSKISRKVSELISELAVAEKQRLEAAGTFIELEELACEIGDQVTRQLLNEQLIDRSNEVAESESACCPDCHSPGSPRDPKRRQLQSTRGELNYYEPSFYCLNCRRSFFPSSRPDGPSRSRHGDAQDASVDGLGGV